MGLVVRSALGLVKGRLGTGLGVVGLATTDNAVSSVGDVLGELLLGGLGGVRSKLLLGLCSDVSNRSRGSNHKRGSWNAYW